MDELELALLTPEESRGRARKTYNTWWKSTKLFLMSELERAARYEELTVVRRYCAHEKERNKNRCVHCKWGFFAWTN
jgi:hypothetical protein